MSARDPSVRSAYRRNEARRRAPDGRSGAATRATLDVTAPDVKRLYAKNDINTYGLVPALEL